MKKIVIISLIIFWTVMIAILAAGLVVYEFNKRSPKSASYIRSDVAGENNQLKGAVLSAEELAKHNNRSSCWLLVDNKVYDLTNFLDLHPGSAAAILPSCGTDATQNYNTKNQPEPKAHSANARELLAAYYLGDFGKIVYDVPQNTGGQPVEPAVAAGGPSVLLSIEEVLRHNKQSDCWMIIENKIYNVTLFFGAHPGGIQNILNYCGGDGTNAFATKGGAGKTHSANAHELLRSFYVGDVGQNVSTNQTQPKVDITQLPAGDDDDEEEEEED